MVPASLVTKQRAPAANAHHLAGFGLPHGKRACAAEDGNSIRRAQRRIKRVFHIAHLANIIPAKVFFHLGQHRVKPGNKQNNAAYLA